MSTSPARKRRLGLILLLLILIGVPLLFTRSFFLTGVVLPLVSNATGYGITADRIRLGCAVQIAHLEVTGLPDVNTLKIPAAEVVPYWSRLIGGKMAFDSIVLKEPEIEILIPASTPSTEEPLEAASEEPPGIVLNEFRIEGGSLRLNIGHQQLVSLGLETLSVRDLAPSSPASLQGSLQIDYVDEGGKPAADTPVQAGKGNWTGDLRVALSERLMPTSLQGETTLKWKSSVPDLPEVILTLKPDLTMDLEAKKLSMKALDARAITGGTERLVVELSQPTTVDWSQQPPTIGDTSLRVHLNRSRLEELPFSALLPVQEGVVELTAEVNVTDSGTSFRGHIRGSGDQLQGMVETYPLTDGAFTIDVQASGTLESITVSSAEFAFRNQGADVSSFSASGSASPTDGSADLTVADLFVDLASFQFLMPETPLIDGHLSASGRITRSSEGTVRFRAGSSLKPSPSSARSPLPLPLEVDAVGELTPRTLLIRTGHVAWPPDADHANRIRLTASADWSDSQAPKGDVQLEAATVDLTPWKAVLPAQGAEGDDAPAAKAKDPGKAIALEPLPLGPSSVSLLADRIRYESLELEEVEVHVAAGPTSLVLHPIRMTAGDSVFTTSSSLEWPEGSPRFLMSAKLTPLEIGPYLDRFLPDMKGAVQGLLSFDTNLEGTASTPVELVRSLKGSLKAEVTEGRIRLFAPVPDAPEGLLQTQQLLESIIRGLATALAVPPEQLLDPPVERLVVDAAIEQQQMQVKTFQAENSEFRLTATGGLPLKAGDLGETAVHDIPVALGVNTNIAKRIRIYREDRLVDNKIMLPPVVDIQGTLAAPEVEVRKRAIAGLVITGVTERNSTGNENVDAALSILGGLLSGEGPPPTPTPRPPTTP